MVRTVMPKGNDNWMGLVRIALDPEVGIEEAEGR